jgi:hypothetical protein
VSSHVRIEDHCLAELSELAAFAVSSATRKSYLIRERIPYTVEAAAACAVTVRRLLGVDDRESMQGLPSLLARQLSIFFFPGNFADVDAASLVHGGVGCIFLSKGCRCNLLACARELGNLIAAASRSPDLAYANLQPRGVQSLAGGPKEHFSENFASCLLIPPSSLADALITVRRVIRSGAAELGDVEIFHIARLFGVNFKTASRRCERLGLLPLGGASSFLAFLTERFGSVEAREASLALPEAIEAEIPDPARCLLAWSSAKLASGDVSMEELALLSGVDLRTMQEIHLFYKNSGVKP